MKKYFLIISSLFFLAASNSCSESDLELYPPSLDELNSVDTEAKMQQLLNGAYFSIGSTGVFGTKAMVFGDLRGDKMYVNVNPSFLSTYNYNYNSVQQPDLGGFYDGLYSAIAKCNLIINNEKVPGSDNVTKLKGESKIIRGLAYFTLVNYYSASPASGLNQEYGVPLVLEDYDVSIKPARATVAQVYDQIIADLKDGILYGDASPSSKVNLGQAAAKLLLSRVYLTRRAPGDAELALQLATELKNEAISKYNSGASANPFIPGQPVTGDAYYNYFAGGIDEESENHPETVWELDLNVNTNKATGIGANMALAAYYYRQDPKRCFLFNQTFYNSFQASDVRRGPGAATNSLLHQTGVPNGDSPKGYWTNKYPQVTSRDGAQGRYFRNIKILRYSEAFLNRIEALYLTGQNAQALIELNEFSASRSGTTYTGADLLNDILTERSKEFYGEGQRFLDLKRYNISLSRPSNCSVCEVSATDKLYVFPVFVDALNANANLTQYPGYN